MAYIVQISLFVTQSLGLSGIYMIAKSLAENEVKSAYRRSVSALNASSSDEVAKPLSAGGRDRVIDVLRGLCILMMVTSHLDANSSFTVLLHIQKYVTGASGFVFLSGLVLGMVSRRRAAREAIADTNRRIWRRAAQLWLVHCVLMLNLLCFRQTTGRLAGEQGLPSITELGGWMPTIGLVLSLRVQPYIMSVLPMYIVFLCITPLALAALRKKAFGPYLLTMALFYIAAQGGYGPLHSTHVFRCESYFYLGAWQLLFFTGLLTGYYRQELHQSVWAKHQRTLLRICMVMFLSLFVLTTCERFHLGPFAALSTPWHNFLLGKRTLGPLRVIYFVSALLLVFKLFATLLRQNRLRQPLAWMEMLGRNSLYCFILHTVLAYFGAAFEIWTWMRLLRECYVIAGTALISFMAKGRILSRLIPN